ncbi:MAG: FMN-binding protein [Acidobacteriota bacterium]|nr:FMN-binding protein [Acidobacteriota bacterium]
MGKGYITTAWLVLVLALVFGASLAGMELVVAERIAHNKLEETLSQVPRLVPGATRGEPYDMDGRTVYRALGDSDTLGWVVPARATGFADQVEVLVGVDAEVKTITGIYVLSQKETPGLGAKITGDEFQNRFKGKDALVPLEVVKGAAEPGPHQIKAITGATISSVTVADLVNRTVTEVRGPLKAAAGR